MLHCMNPSWMLTIIAVEGAFLQGCFENVEELNIDIADGFQKWYVDDVVLRMNVPL